jgi:hypothetical protein
MKTTTALPRARSKELVMESLPDEVLVYDMRRQKSHCLNQTAALIWDHCDGETSPAQMAQALSRQLNASITEEMIWVGLKQLAGAQLLEERIVAPSNLAKVSRRELVQKLGLTAAVALPLILTITAPMAKAQASCRPTGSACTSNSQCCSGLCLGTGRCA